MTEVCWRGPAATEVGIRGGTLQTSVVASSIVANRVEGYFDLPLSRRIVDIANEIVEKRGTVVVFSDWWEMSGYDAECRTFMTQWAVGLGDKLEAFHVITGSKLVTMGVTVASIVVRNLRSHKGRAELTSAFNARVARAGP